MILNDSSVLQLVVVYIHHFQPVFLSCLTRLSSIVAVFEFKHFCSWVRIVYQYVQWLQAYANLIYIYIYILNLLCSLCNIFRWSLYTTSIWMLSRSPDWNSKVQEKFGRNWIGNTCQKDPWYVKGMLYLYSEAIIASWFQLCLCCFVACIHTTLRLPHSHGDIVFSR